MIVLVNVVVLLQRMHAVFVKVMVLLVLLQTYFSLKQLKVQVVINI